jgi:hypothetical protein
MNISENRAHLNLIKDGIYNLKARENDSVEDNIRKAPEGQSNAMAKILANRQAIAGSDEDDESDAERNSVGEFSFC